MPAYTTLELLNDIKLKAFIPTSQVTFTDDELLAIADNELRTRLMPLITDCREDFYLTSLDYTIGSSLAFDIPTRALGGKIKDIFNIINTQVFPVPYLPLHLQSQDYIPAPRNVYFSFQDAQVVLYNPSQQTPVGTLRLYYYRRPGKLVQQSAGMQVVSIDTLNNQVTVNQVPTSFVVGSVVDMQQAQPHFQYTALDQTIQAITGLTLTFTTLPTNLAVGDWITNSNESVVVQVPVELQNLLASYISVYVLESIGALDEKASMEKSITTLEEGAQNLLSPRSENSPKKILNLRGVLPGTRRWPYYYY